MHSVCCLCGGGCGKLQQGASASPRRRYSHTVFQLLQVCCASDDRDSVMFSSETQQVAANHPPLQAPAHVQVQPLPMPELRQLLAQRQQVGGRRDDGGRGCPRMPVADNGQFRFFFCTLERASTARYAICKLQKRFPPSRLLRSPSPFDARHHPGCCACAACSPLQPTSTRAGYSA